MNRSGSLNLTHFTDWHWRNPILVHRNMHWPDLEIHGMLQTGCSHCPSAHANVHIGLRTWTDFQLDTLSLTSVYYINFHIPKAMWEQIGWTFEPFSRPGQRTLGAQSYSTQCLQSTQAAGAECDETAVRHFPLYKRYSVLVESAGPASAEPQHQ